jgi:hypothetical protein
MDVSVHVFFLFSIHSKMPNKNEEEEEEEKKLSCQPSADSRECCFVQH